jgi:signal transduction histidine kinase
MRQIMRHILRLGTGHDSTLWPVLLLLLVVLVPSAGVVWMMRAAMENERLAVRQRLVDAYRSQLEIAQQRVDDFWQQRIKNLDSSGREDSPQQAFAECLKLELADSVIICDVQGRAIYPAPALAAFVPVRDGAAWGQADRLEFSQQDFAGAARAYGEIEANATDPIAAARARQAAARVLAKQGDTPGAIRALERISGAENVNDSNGRSLAADAELRLVELLDAGAPERTRVIASLRDRLNNYSQPIPADQRRFLMHSLQAAEPEILFPTLAAEDLAAQYLVVSQPLPSAGHLQPTALSNVWQLGTPSKQVIALYNSSTLQRLVEKDLAAQSFPQSVVVAVSGPKTTAEKSGELVSTSLAPTMPGWRLSLSLADPQTFDTAANERMAFFLWTGVVVVAITGALALLVGKMLREQSRLTRLKNDLVATVSHELKTPLASIRLLVDTLLNDTLLDDNHTASSAVSDPVRTREYLELIAKENSRLSRLIDNFLTFSRMERGKHHFDRRETDAANAVDQAVAAVADRFDGVTNTLTVDVQRPLLLDGDVDALVTVVVNLLDNAWKYSDEPREIGVAARRAGDRIVISVTDNGIGLSPRAVRKVFDRFYQVDQHLSRSHDGCGLGLSIVKHIVTAHGGQVAVESRLGEGSKFTVSLPVNAIASVQTAKPMSVS